jgi:hypothetical protein
MSFETISLLLNWVQLGVLLAILFRLSHTFSLIANTQRELRRAIYHPNSGSWMIARWRRIGANHRDGDRDDESGGSPGG